MVPKVEIVQRNHLSKKARKQLVAGLEAVFGPGIGDVIDRKDVVEEGRLSDGGKVLLVNRKVAFFKEAMRVEDDEDGMTAWIPLIDTARGLGLKAITIDQPAVPYISAGADVMRPGIVEIDPEIKENEQVSIIDEKNHVILAIGRALFDGDTMASMTKGKVVKTVHHVGDKIWALKQGT